MDEVVFVRLRWVQQPSSNWSITKFACGLRGMCDEDFSVARDIRLVGCL